MSGGPRAKPSLLKVIHGDRHTETLKNDKPKFAAPPEPPPGTVLTELEQQMWDWLIRHVYLQGVHASGDGGMFVKVVRLWVRAMEADAKVAELGLTALNRLGKTEVSAYARLSRDLWQQLGVALAEIGATPSGRVKLAAPPDDGEGASWSSID
jgi:hypothetical protein